ncbi:hypothetical protein C8Q74DRAFT_1307971 [Fomes fomentarius]|nr:hypothetical protein C8Q74DRAFT_1307971 [Fomes fomentarius]
MISAQQEYQVIWKRKFSVPMALFVVNRCSLVLHGILYLFWYLMWWESDLSPPRFALHSHKLDSCEVIGRASCIVAILLDAVNGIFTAVRIHAINHRNWYWTTVVLVLGICAIPKNIAFVTTAHFQTNYPLFPGCNRDEGILKPDQDTWLKESDLLGAVTLSTRILHRIVQNVLVLGITWYRTYEIVIDAWKASCRTSVVSVMLRDAGVVTLGMAVIILIDMPKQQGSHNLNVPIYAHRIYLGAAIPFHIHPLSFRCQGST